MLVTPRTFRIRIHSWFLLLLTFLIGLPSHSYALKKGPPPTFMDMIKGGEVVFTAQADKEEEIKKEDVFCGTRIYLKNAAPIVGEDSVSEVFDWTGVARRSVLQSSWPGRVLVAAKRVKYADSGIVGEYANCVETIDGLGLMTVTGYFYLSKLSVMNELNEDSQHETVRIGFKQMTPPLADGISGWITFRGDLVICTSPSVCQKEKEGVRNWTYSGMEYFVSLDFVKKLLGVDESRDDADLKNEN